MATFVLVHGSWAGSVVWRLLVQKLLILGTTYTLRPTGIGARKQRLNCQVNLDTHIQDVIGRYRRQGSVE